MPGPSITPSTITYPSQLKTISAEFYTPATSPATGVVVIAYGSDGLVDSDNGPWETMIRGYAAALADAGYLAMIPDYFAVTGTSPGLNAIASIPSCRDQWQTAITDAIGHAKGLAGVTTPRTTGLLGFSLGGHLCLRVRDHADVMVLYFSPVFDGIGSRPTIARLTDLQIHQGDPDPLVGVDNANEIERLLTGEGAKVDLHVYAGAGHGFVGTDHANTKARTDSLQDTVDFFRAHLP